jgi:hypothetical protein
MYAGETSILAVMCWLVVGIIVVLATFVAFWFVEGTTFSDSTIWGKLVHVYVWCVGVAFVLFILYGVSGIIAHIIEFNRTHQ